VLYQRTYQRPYQRTVRQVVIAAARHAPRWTVFPFVWILLTSLKTRATSLGAADVHFTPTIDNYSAGDRRAGRTVLLDAPGLSAVLPQQHDHLDRRGGAVGRGRHPRRLRIGALHLPTEGAFGFVLRSFRFVPFIAFVIPLYVLYQQFGLYNTHAG